MQLHRVGQYSTSLPTIYLVLSLLNLVKHAVLVVVPEWGVSNQQDVQYDSTCPDVHCVCVGFLTEYLWGEVARGPSKSYRRRMQETKKFT